jgi:polysaccharide biosynthesis transport protein
VNFQNHDNTPEGWEEKNLVFANVLRVVKKYAWLIGVLSIGLGALTYIWSKKQPRKYDATAMVEVDQHNGPSLASNIAASDEFELKITTEILALQSHDVSMGVIKRLKLDSNELFNQNYPRFADFSDPEAREYLLSRFLMSLEVTRVPKSQLISVTFRSLSPVLSAEVANAIVDTYLEENFHHHYQGSKEITGWLTGELDELKGRVQKEQIDLLNQEVKLGIFGGADIGNEKGGGGTTSLYQTQMEGLLDQLVKAQTARFIADAKYQSVKSASAETPLDKSVPGTEVLASEQGQLIQVQGQAAALADRYGPGYTPLQALKQQESALKADIAQRREAINSASFATLTAAKYTESQLQSSIDNLKGHAQGLNPEVVRYQVIRAQYLADQTLLNNLLMLLSAGGIQEGLRSKEVNRMSSALIPYRASQPRVLVNTASGCGIGLLLAATVITTLTAFSDTLETVEQIEDAIKLPLLGVVPIYKQTGTVGAALPIAVAAAPRSAVSEAYRTLRTVISLVPASGNCRVVGITSCGPAEGKSTTALNLAIATSQLNKRVLLIDGDLRRPILAAGLGVMTPHVGLSRFLSDPTISPEECVETSDEFPSLSFGFVHEIPPFPSELLGQGRFEELIRWARENFDVVIVDSPPALLVTDALIIAQSVDIVLIVTRVGMTQRRALRRVRQELVTFPRKQIGVLVNAVPVSQSYYTGYGGYHGYYGSNGANVNPSERQDKEATPRSR